MGKLLVILKNSSSLHCRLALTNSVHGNCHDHFYFIESDDSTPDIDWLLDKARIAVMRNGVKGVIIDPYNEISAKREGTKREDEHIRDLISSCKKFTRNYDIAMWLVAHHIRGMRAADENNPEPSTLHPKVWRERAMA